jgi:hypothetical protein
VGDSLSAQTQDHPRIRCSSPSRPPTVPLSGTGFATGAKLKGPTGVSFGKAVVVDATTITAKATVSSAATVGTGLAVTVTNDAAAGYGTATAKLLTITR